MKEKFLELVRNFKMDWENYRMDKLEEEMMKEESKEFDLTCAFCDEVCKSDYLLIKHESLCYRQKVLGLLQEIINSVDALPR